MPDSGTLKISILSSVGMIPIENALISISYTGEPEVTLMEVTTDSSGQTQILSLDAPDVELSLQADNLIQPYSEYNISVTAEGYEPAYVTGVEILATRLALQNIMMTPLAVTNELSESIIIPAHTLYGNYPPKIPEAEIKPIDETGEIVLSRVVVPEYIIVHDGDFVRAGEPLSDGSEASDEILRICGKEALQEHLVNKVQQVYRVQGVEINDKQSVYGRDRQYPRTMLVGTQGYPHRYGKGDSSGKSRDRQGTAQRSAHSR